jgi:serine/threonine protein kinase
MAKGTNKQFSTVSSRQIPQTRLYDDGNLETRYEILNKLGEGSFGSVYRVRNKENLLFYAMKTIPKKVIKKKVFALRKQIFFSLSLEINLKHPVLIMK